MGLHKSLAARKRKADKFASRKVQAFTTKLIQLMGAGLPEKTVKASKRTVKVK